MVGASNVAEAVREAIGRAATTLRPDVLDALQTAARTEPSKRGRRVLEQLLENARIAERDVVPICQDTGTVWVWVELGAEEALGSDPQGSIDEAVASAFREHALRASLVRDALFDRTNTGDNTPAFVDVSLRPGRGATVHVMLKGGGSDNASVVAMLDPGEGAEGVRRLVLDTVEARASAACPPLLVGVGVGTTFDEVGRLAKRALLRPVGTRPPEGGSDRFEQDLLEAVNATGIGPAGLGGRTTALGVHVVTAPCHIASLPVAVTLGCSAVRSARVEIA